MKFLSASRTLVACGVLLAAANPVHVRADEHENRFVTEGEVLEIGPGKYWIGVQLEPIGEALKSQLKLREGMLVVRVVDDGPADKAGLQKNDILLNYEDLAVDSVEDLVKAIVDRKDKPAKLWVVREGQRVTLEVAAEERPDGPVVLGQHEFNDVAEISKVFEGMLKDKSMPYRILTMGPGVLEHKDISKWIMDDVPENLSITIKKTGKQPAQITVEKGNDKWQVSEEELDNLPEDVRGHVRRMVGPTAFRAWSPGVKNIWLKNFELKEDGKNITSALDRAIHVSPHVKKMIEEAQNKKAEKSDSLEALRSEVQAIRRELKALLESKE